MSIDRDDSVALGSNYFFKRFLLDWNAVHDMSPKEATLNTQIEFCENSFRQEVAVFLESDNLPSENSLKVRYLQMLLCWLLSLNANKALILVEKCINVLVVEMYGNEQKASNAEILVNALVFFVHAVFSNEDLSSIFQHVDDKKEKS